ncbi:hypothetical protein J4Q44_G00071360 [Coregonus suidteri]|uniref:OB domain-containing protein n=1 Tax=Coregonus suidteri TaxID=861788 RepID=A0AAN8M545_9TELE
MGLVDDTDCVEVIVFGKDRYNFFQKGIYYLFRNLIMSDDTVKFTSRSNVSKTSSFEVPEWLDEEAWTLIHQAVLSIADANESDSGTKMSIQGTVIEEGTGKVKVKKQRKLPAQRFLTLQDETKQNSIEICFWGDQVSCAAMVGIGDTIRVTNVYSSEYEDSISLNSTK